MHTLPNLPDSTACGVLATLCASLPAPIAGTPEDRASRDEIATAAVAALHPTNAFEAKLAADIVLAEAHYADSLRQAGEHRGDLAATSGCRAQAMGMLRQMRGLLRDYLRMQAERDKALAAMHPAAMERAGTGSAKPRCPRRRNRLSCAGGAVRGRRRASRGRFRRTDRSRAVRAAVSRSRPPHPRRGRPA
ncbi:MAG TPA: hypothetical protein VGI78_26695, partial [Acetobacteraceae bacterium]